MFTLCFKIINYWKRYRLLETVWNITLPTTLSQFHPYIAFLFISALRRGPSIRSILSTMCLFLIPQCILHVSFTYVL
jgi:hypothetical protein